MTDYTFAELALEYLEDLTKLDLSQEDFEHLVRAFLIIVRLHYGGKQ